MGQAGRDGRDGRDVLAVLRRAWDRLVGWSGWFCCAPSCVVQAGRDGRDGADTAARAEIFPN